MNDCKCPTEEDAETTCQVDSDQTPDPASLAPLSAERADVLASALKALGHPIRLRLVSLVASHPTGEACVCSISAGFNVSAPTISHHLRMLRSAGVLDCQRRGSWVYYRVCSGMLEELAAVIGPLEPRPAPPTAAPVPAYG